ncbi:MAG: hypothetical protein FJW95_04645, partial [Actinobacteria bacterium]|nr:hypothetical protein [Actinomycetota bacterium]
VPCQQPARAAPRLRASTARPLSEPKLMLEMLTADGGRKASRRPRAAPSTLAIGSAALGSSPGSPRCGSSSGKGACLMIR